jgi:hypothetical protein
LSSNFALILTKMSLRFIGDGSSRAAALPAYGPAPHCTP